MSLGEVEAIGAHCQLPFCHQLDFLPFPCESCRGVFCLDHRSETAHSCPNAGEWSLRRAQLENPPSSFPTSQPVEKPTILTHEYQCSETSCKTLINTALVPAISCPKCLRDFCLKHRNCEQHACAGPPSVPTVDSGVADRAQTALARLRLWSAAKSKSLLSSSTSSPVPKPPSRIKIITELKSNAKGDAKIPIADRVYLIVEAEAQNATQPAQAKLFFNKSWSVGKLLDSAARFVKVSNVNNTAQSEDLKLRVYHVDKGRLLEFQEVVGNVCKDGETVVLLRGAGVGLTNESIKVGDSGAGSID